MGNLRLIKVDAAHPDLAILIHKLDEYLLMRYPADEVYGIDFSDPLVEDVIFIIAYFNGVPAGCGAIREIDSESTELKRFFVEQDYRNKGIAQVILEELESRAMMKGYTSIKLEAGEAQPEALTFYRKHGYYQIDKFGDYIDSESSVCYEKKLK